jgi:hypothetical protein
MHRKIANEVAEMDLVRMMSEDREVDPVLIIGSSVAAAMCGHSSKTGLSVDASGSLCHQG